MFLAISGNRERDGLTSALQLRSNRKLYELGTQGVWEYDMFQQRRYYCRALMLFIPLFAFLW